MVTNKSKADKRVLVLFYLLIFYIIVQFAWWAYMLIKLNRALYSVPEILEKKVWMVVGEGMVFFIFLLAGVYIMQRSIRKEMSLARQQSNFLLSITHELKTPLASIRLCIETLEKHRALPDEKRESLQKNALSNTDRLGKLIDKVLLATSIESSHQPVAVGEIDLSELCKQIVKRFLESHLIQEDQILLTTDSNSYSRIDPQYFDSIVSNLIENAIKYGGERKISVNLESTDNHIELRVADQGQGINPKNKAKIFEKFFREGNEETRTKKGTGLGLFIVKKLVELHNGTIKVENNNPQGSIFTVILPR